MAVADPEPQLITFQSTFPLESTSGKPTSRPRSPLSLVNLDSFGVFMPAEVDRLRAEEARTEMLVDTFVPIDSIAIAAGDSTIGKSPLMYQLGLCVAAGVPFLGHNARQGRVIYFDLENSLDDSRTMRDALVRFLGLRVAPEDFLLATEPLAMRRLKRLAEKIGPSLVIIDSLRAFAPEVTGENTKAAVT